jgi:hypothetical protein
MKATSAHVLLSKSDPQISGTDRVVAIHARAISKYSWMGIVEKCVPMNMHNGVPLSDGS